MNNDVVVFLPNIILLAIFIIFLWRRHSLKGFDWVALVTIILGGALLALVAARIIYSPDPDNRILQIVLFLIPVLVFVIYLFFIFRLLPFEKIKTRLHFDERMNTVNSKSARNALAAVYSSSVINLILYPQISRSGLAIILVFSLLVYLVSLVIYHRRSIL
ncbi:MAG TPA: hypothetical protein VLH15_00960 [Dehalococcoidales bacterium]|nr:hypothetical protein [Dehalococcoidales bacterium]